MRWLALLTALLLAGCADDDPPRPETSTAHGRGVTAQLPVGWRTTRQNLMPNLGDPRLVFVAATYPLQYRERDCAHVPGSALEDLGPTDAFIDLEERARPSGLPPRPAEFGPELGSRSEASECVPQARFLDHWFDFTDNGRHFHVRVAFGPETSAETREEAWSILESLRIDPAVRPDWTGVG